MTIRRILALPLLALAVSAAALATLFTAPAAAQAGTAPQPDPIPSRWEFRFEPGPLRVITVDTPELGEPVAYYYMTYYVENNSGEDRYFAPKFELVTDAGEIIRSGRDVPRVAREAILDALRNPVLNDEIRVQGTLRQGEDNGREGLVVWPVGETQVDEVQVFAAGFSGEFATVVRPDNGETVLLRKTRMLTYVVPGTLQTNSDRPLRAVGIDRWIMR